MCVCYTSCGRRHQRVLMPGNLNGHDGSTHLWPRSAVSFNCLLSGSATRVTPTGTTRVGGLLCRTVCEMLSLRQFLRLRIVRLDGRQRVTRRVFQLLIPP
jgi:hypothetical protein